MESQKYQSLVAAFEAWDVKISEFITFLLSSSSLRKSSLVHDLHTNGSVISFAINTVFPFTSAPTSDVAFQTICEHLKDETQSLISQSENQGWQFGAVHAQAQQFDQFRIDEMARRMAAISPQLWHLIGSLVSTKYNPHELLEVDISDVNELEVGESNDLGDMLQDLTEDNPTREARKIANEKAMISLVLVILFFDRHHILNFYLENCNNTFHYSPQPKPESECLRNNDRIIPPFLQDS
jgi:hypothetical protein